MKLKYNRIYGLYHQKDPYGLNVKNNSKIIKDERENLLPPINNGMNQGDISGSLSEFSKNGTRKIKKISKEKNDMSNSMSENLDQINSYDRNGLSVEKKINKKVIKENTHEDYKKTYSEIHDRVRKILKEI